MGSEMCIRDRLKMHLKMRAKRAQKSPKMEPKVTIWRPKVAKKSPKRGANADTSALVTKMRPKIAQIWPQNLSNSLTAAHGQWFGEKMEGFCAAFRRTLHHQGLPACTLEFLENEGSQGGITWGILLASGQALTSHPTLVRQKLRRTCSGYW